MEMDFPNARSEGPPLYLAMRVDSYSHDASLLFLPKQLPNIERPFDFLFPAFIRDRRHLLFVSVDPYQV
uniref:Proannomuricatin JK n=1 Tax=Annona muricata TaxID=13337 RepID=A0A5B9T618_ANNMU|nr:proannomuricatin JK [Annona muricata]